MGLVPAARILPRDIANERGLSINNGGTINNAIKATIVGGRQEQPVAILEGLVV